MTIHRALSRALVHFEERDGTKTTSMRARGRMRFGRELEGPPGRLHGGYHVVVRTLPILERIGAHPKEETYPCAIDARMLRGLPLEEDVSFEARYTREGDGGWALETHFEDTERLLAHAHSLPDAPLASSEELARWRPIFEESDPPESSFQLFGSTLHVAPKMVWLTADESSRQSPESQHAALVEPNGCFGLAFVATQLDMVGAAARGTVMRHPHFTKHLELSLASGAIPKERRLLCLADRSQVKEELDSGTKPVEIKGKVYGTATVPVILVDEDFSTAYATGAITVHPVDPEKFEELQKMRELRKDT